MGIRVIRLKIFPVGSAETRRAVWKRIRELDWMSWRAANYLVGSHYFNDTFMTRSAARLKIAKDDPERAAKLSAFEAHFAATFGVKRQATGERDIKDAFPDLPPAISNPLAQNVYANYRAHKADLLKGRRAIDYYKSGMPIPVAPGRISFETDERGYIRAVIKFARHETIPFGIMFGRDRAGYRGTITAVAEGALKAGGSKLQLRKGTLYLLLSITYPDEKLDLDPETRVAVRMGVQSVAACAITGRTHVVTLGDRDDFLRVRRQMDQRRERVQRAARQARGGHGRKKKMRAVAEFGDKERRWVRSYNHTISARVARITEREGAGVVVLEMLKGFAGTSEAPHLLRYWSFFELQTMIAEKVSRFGARVMFVDPTNLSVDDEEAARSMLTMREVTKPEDCEYARLGAQPNSEGSRVPVPTH